MRAAEPKVPVIDLPTLAVGLGMTGGFVAIVILTHQGHVPPLAAALIGTWLMNASFTAWHESSHGNFSRSSRFGDAFGWLTSLASVFPGYYARRREHLAHHHWQGDATRDPVYPRIQCGVLAFPFRLALLRLQGRENPIPKGYLPITRGQAWADRISNLLVLGILAASIAGGWFVALAWGWVLPRIAVYLIHAYYICLSAHSVEGGGYQLYRVRPNSRLLAFLTWNQSLHGVHHLRPRILWHSYRRTLNGMSSAERSAAGMEVLG